jgi:MYXO-CTERM domain-containing protein
MAVTLRRAAMNDARWVVGVMLAAGLLTGCSGQSSDTEDLARSTEALNVCNEDVPADHIIDGIPAYAQCSATTGAIYSNNGIDTSTTSGGTDWVRTQWSGGYQCTEYAQRYLYFKWNVKAIFNVDAQDWCSHALPSNLVKSAAPVHGDVIVFAAGVCGASSVGHVAVIDVVDGAASKLTFVDENGIGRGTYDMSCGSCFVHATANSGSAGGGGVPGIGGATGIGGTVSTGGTFTTGGLTAAGGKSASTAGASTGGAISTGGNATATGGSLGNGGKSVGIGGERAGTGGMPVAGGSVGNGGTTGSSTQAGAPTMADAGASEEPGGQDAGSTTASKEASEGCSCRVATEQSQRAIPSSLVILLGLGVAGRLRRRRA